MGGIVLTCKLPLSGSPRLSTMSTCRRRTLALVGTLGPGAGSEGAIRGPS